MRGVLTSRVAAAFRDLRIKGNPVGGRGVYFLTNSWASLSVFGYATERPVAVVDAPESKPVGNKKTNFLPLLLVTGRRRFELAGKSDCGCAAMGAWSLVHAWRERTPE